MCEDYARRHRTGNNATAAKWKLAKLPEEYFHSSASFYILNQAHKFVRLTHWKDVGERVAHRLVRETMRDICLSVGVLTNRKDIKFKHEYFS